MMSSVEKEALDAGYDHGFRGCSRTDKYDRYFKMSYDRGYHLGRQDRDKQCLWCDTIKINNVCPKCTGE